MVDTLATAAAAGGALGLAASIAVRAAGWPATPVWARGLVAIAAVGAAWIIAWHRRSRWASRSVAASADAALDARNEIVAAEQIARGALHASPAIAARLLADAQARLQGASPGDVTPAWRAALAAGAGAATLATALLIAVGPPTVRDALAGGDLAPQATPTGAGGVSLRIVEPAYRRAAPRTLLNPTRADVIAGSVIEVAGVGDGWRVGGAWDGIALAPGPAAGSTLVTPPIAASGALALTLARAGDVLERRTIAIVAHPDPLPTVTIDAPGRDLLVDAVTMPLDLRVSASDDGTLTQVQVRFTKVTGSGEQFDFVEGTVPVAVRAESASAWRGTARLPLPDLALAPGDLVAYRAIARDARGPTGEGASDTYVLRVTQPGDVASAGFAIDEDENKFALSQQMLLVKLERLHAERPRLAREAVEARSADLAIEQRMIRNEFSFMVGGEVEDEEEEAAHSHEIAEGRDDNQGRRDVLAAIRAMSRAEQTLNRADTAASLVHVRDAVTALQRAFSRTRYLLRTLPVRARIDLERRLSGDASGTGPLRRVSRPAGEAARVAEARRLGAAIAALAGRVGRHDLAGGNDDALGLASGLVALDPRSPSLIEAAGQVLDAWRAAEAGRADDARALLADAYAALVADQRTRLTPGDATPSRPSPLRAALAGQDRRPGGGTR